MDPKNHMTRQAGKLRAVGEEHGWQYSEEWDDDTLRAKVVRGDEVIEIEWTNGKLFIAPTYTFAGETTLNRNLADCLRHVKAKPNFARAARRARRKRSTSTVAAMASAPGYDVPGNGLPSDGTPEFSRALPWNPDELDDKTLLKQCYCRTLLWKNSITGEVNEDTVLRGINFNAQIYKIKYSSSGRRIIMFHGQQGFRSVGVDALLQVR